jgi:hypothetical protein
MGKHALLVLVSVLLLGVAGLAGAAPEKADDGPDTNTLFRKAFPGDKRVLHSAIKFHRVRKGLLMAAETFTVSEDRRIMLTDFAMAWVGKGDDEVPTALRSSAAVITLDRPIEKFEEFGTRKIVSIELAGGVRITLDK